MKQDLRLTLENPVWRDMVVANAKEYKTKGTLSDFLEVNNFEPEVISFIEAYI